MEDDWKFDPKDMVKTWRTKEEMLSHGRPKCDEKTLNLYVDLLIEMGIEHAGLSLKLVTETDDKGNTIDSFVDKDGKKYSVDEAFRYVAKKCKDKGVPMGFDPKEMLWNFKDFAKY